MATKKQTRDSVFDPATYEYADCREQHIWQHYDGTLVPKEKIAYQVQKCANCTTKRKRILSIRTGEVGKVLSRSYKYVEGYSVPGGLDWRDLGEIRMRNFLAQLGAQQ